MHKPGGQSKHHHSAKQSAKHHKRARSHPKTAHHPVKKHTGGHLTQGTGKGHHATKPKRHANRHASLHGIREGDAVQFGRTEPYARHEKPRLVIDHYLDTWAMPIAPAIVDRASKVTGWPMYGNDNIGDCTCAAAGHQIQAWTAYANTESTITDQDVLKAYEAVSGYDPATGENDNGANVQDVLNYWRKHGIGGHKIAGFAELSAMDNLHFVRHALHLFGSVYLGIDVPQSAMDQFDAGQPWSDTGDQEILGGHAVPIQYMGQPGVSPKGVIHVVTWGQVQHMTFPFYFKYTTEAWVIFTDDWLNRVTNETPDGFNLDQLRADFMALTGQSMD